MKRAPSQSTEARKALKAVHNATIRGILPDLKIRYISCYDCNTARATEWDHRDYSRPLEVHPVCHPCNYKRGTPDYGLGSRYKPIYPFTTKLTLEQAREIRERYKRGEKKKILSEEHSVPCSLISRIIHSRSWSDRLSDTPIARRNAATNKSEIIRLRAAGATQKDIAQQFNFSVATVNNWLKLWNAEKPSTTARLKFSRWKRRGSLNDAIRNSLIAGSRNEL